MFSQTILALDLSWFPTARASTRGDDNLRNATTGQEAAWGFDTGAGVNVLARTDRLRSELYPKFNARRFIIGENADADEYSVLFNNDWTDERFSSGLDVSYARDSTLIFEATDTGQQEAITYRDSLNVQPNVTYRINEAWTTQASVLYSDVNYIDDLDTGLIDYRYLQTSGGLNWQWRANSALFGSFAASNFDTPDTRSSTLSYSGQGGISWQWSETLQTSASVGWIASTIKFIEQRPTLALSPLRIVIVEDKQVLQAAGPMASVGIKKSFAEMDWSFDYSRQVSPNGRGTQSEGDRLSLHGEYRATQRLTFFFDGIYDLRRTEGSRPLTGIDRDLAELKGIARYRIFQDWAISATFRFARTSFEINQSSRTAEQATLYLAIDYAAQPRSLASFDGF